jgi:V8-like Glu-specific endopeptidase
MIGVSTDSQGDITEWTIVVVGFPSGSISNGYLQTVFVPGYDNNTDGVGNLVFSPYENLSDGYNISDPGIWTTTAATPLLFTIDADAVDFNNLTTDQQAAISDGADIYHGLGGSDVVTLPDEANYNESVSNGQTLGWTDTAASTFYTSSQIGDIYTVSGSDGDYDIVEGAGTEFITINGDGSSDITAGSGSDTISITGDGDNTISAGTGSANVSIIGSGDNEFDGNLTGSASISGGGTLDITGTFDGSATIGANSTLELGGAASGGAITFTSGGTGETLLIDGTAMPTNVIAGFQQGDTIDLPEVPYNSQSGASVFEENNVLHLVENNKSYDLNLDPSQSFSGGFSLTGDGNGGTDVTISPNPATSYSTIVDPYDSVCYITCDGFRGSGFIIGPDTILTAAHVVLGDGTNNVGTNIVVYPGDSTGDLGALAYTINPSDVRTDTDYNNTIPFSNSNEQYDFAIIHIPNADFSSYFDLDANFPGGTVNLTGYPATPPGFSGSVQAGTQYNDIQTITQDPNFTLWDYSNVFPYGGASGSPLWVSDGSNTEAVGVHVATGEALQLTSADLKTISDWEKALQSVSSDFTGAGTSDILYEDHDPDVGFYQMDNGTNVGWHDIGAFSSSYAVVGSGDFIGNGTSDVLFRDSATGDTGFYAISNGINVGWYDIGGSSTTYVVAGVGDFYGNGTDDVLFRNNATGDTGFYAISNGVYAGWLDVGPSSTAYSVVGVGDFMGNGTDDILFRNDTTGDTGFYQISNGVNTGWVDVGPSSTAYSVVGVGDFMGNGTDDILFRNNATGDTGFYNIANGINTGWYDIGASSTAYAVVATGDYLGTGTSDILFRNNTTGDTGFYRIVNGANVGWVDVGASSTAYRVAS